VDTRVSRNFAGIESEDVACRFKAQVQQRAPSRSKWNSHCVAATNQRLQRISKDFLVKEVIAESTHSNLMGKKKKLQKEDTTKPSQDSSKDIDDIFAEKQPKTAAEQKSLTGKSDMTKSSRQSMETTAGDDLATIQKKITTAKMKEPNFIAKVVADDDFADIRGTKKRTLPSIMTLN
jgi:hypothetical protein